MNQPQDDPKRDAQQPQATGPGSLSLRDRVQSLRLPDRPPQRRSVLAVVPWFLCLVLLGTTVAFAVRGGIQDKAASEEATQRERETIAQPMALGLQPGDVMLESKGYIIPIHQIQVSPKVSGMVMSLKFEEGMVVQKGEVLAVLEKVEYLADRDRTKAQVDAYTSKWEELTLGLEFLIKQAEADLEDAKAQYQNELVQLKSEVNSKDGVSAVDVLKRRAAVDAKKARVTWHENQLEMINKGLLARRVSAAKGEMEQWKAELVKSEWRLSNCVITAPVTGVILKKQAEEGSLVNPSAFSNGLSASLCDMADLAELEVDLSVPERDVARLIDFKLSHKKPQKCQVRADAFPNRAFAAYLSRIMPTADQSKAAVPVRVKIIIPASDVAIYLRPQMNAAVTFFNEESEVAPTRIEQNDQ